MADAIVDYPLGLGTGMNTGPARHVVSDPSKLSGLESYYAKAIVELGFFGFVAVIALFTSIIVTGHRQLKRLKDPGLKSCAAAFVAFFISMAIHSAKGWHIDVDPLNVYYWVMVGILFRLRYLEPAAVGAQTRARLKPNAVRAVRPHLVGGRRSPALPPTRR